MAEARRCHTLTIVRQEYHCALDYTDKALDAAEKRVHRHAKAIGVAPVGFAPVNRMIVDRRTDDVDPELIELQREMRENADAHDTTDPLVVRYGRILAYEAAARGMSLRQMSAALDALDSP